VSDAGFSAGLVISGCAPIPMVPASTKPLPVPYLQAVKALAACRTMDEAKYWNDASDALAAWAKIYADDAVSNEARALKLHAYRRIGALAEELQPGAAGNGHGRQPGPFKLLRAHGFSAHQAAAARKLATIEPPEFDRLVSARRPPSPVSVHVTKLRGDVDFVNYRRRIQSLLPVLRRVRARDMAKFVSSKKARKMAEDAIEAAEWLNDLACAISPDRGSRGTT
jgi:hypothetical protein